MMNKPIAVMGLGEFARQTTSRIEQEFGNYESIEFKAPSLDSHEEYEKYAEKNFLDIVPEILKDGREKFILFLNADRRTGLALPLLQALKDHIELEIVFIKLGGLCANREMFHIERFISGVFQEMTRSGLLDHLYLFDVERIEEIYDIEAEGMVDYYNKISSIIAKVIHSKNVYEHSESFVMSNLGILDPKEAERLENISRISTFFIFNIKEFAVEQERQIFFPVGDACKLVYNLSTNKGLTKLRKTIKNSSRLERKDQIVIFKIFDLGSDFQLGELFVSEPQY